MRIGPISSLVAVVAIKVFANAQCTWDDCSAALMIGEGGYDHALLARRDCARLLPATATGSPVTVTEFSTFTVTVTAAPAPRRHERIHVKRQEVGVVSSFDLPTYASACSNFAAYSRACSCLGVVPTATVAATVTITAVATDTVTVPWISTGIVETGTGTGVESSHTVGPTGIWSNTTSFAPSTSPSSSILGTGTAIESSGTAGPTGLWTNTTSFASATASSQSDSVTSSPPDATGSGSTILPPFNNSSTTFATTTLTTNSTFTTSLPTPTPGICPVNLIQTCPFTQSCQPNVPNSPCVCAQSTEGEGLCVNRLQLCSTLTPCENSLYCAAGFRCAIGSCCNTPVCVQLGGGCGSAASTPIPGGIGRREAPEQQGLILGGENDWTFG